MELNRLLGWTLAFGFALLIVSAMSGDVRRGLGLTVPNIAAALLIVAAVFAAYRIVSPSEGTLLSSFTGTDAAEILPARIELELREIHALTEAAPSSWRAAKEPAIGLLMDQVSGQELLRRPEAPPLILDGASLSAGGVSVSPAKLWSALRRRSDTIGGVLTERKGRAELLVAGSIGGQAFAERLEARSIDEIARELSARLYARLAKVPVEGRDAARFVVALAEFRRYARYNDAPALVRAEAAIDCVVDERPNWREARLLAAIVHNEMGQLIRASRAPTAASEGTSEAEERVAEASSDDTDMNPVSTPASSETKLGPDPASEGVCEASAPRAADESKALKPPTPIDGDGKISTLATKEIPEPPPSTPEDKHREALEILLRGPADADADPRNGLARVEEALTLGTLIQIVQRGQATPEESAEFASLYDLLKARHVAGASPPPRAMTDVDQIERGVLVRASFTLSQRQGADEALSGASAPLGPRDALAILDGMPDGPRRFEAAHLHFSAAVAGATLLSVISGSHRDDAVRTKRLHEAKQGLRDTIARRSAIINDPTRVPTDVHTQHTALGSELLVHHHIAALLGDTDAETLREAQRSVERSLRSFVPLAGPNEAPWLASALAQSLAHDYEANAREVHRHLGLIRVEADAKSAELSETFRLNAPERWSDNDRGVLRARLFSDGKASGPRNTLLEWWLAARAIEPGNAIGPPALDEATWDAHRVGLCNATHKASSFWLYEIPAFVIDDLAKLRLGPAGALSKPCTPKEGDGA